MVTRWKAFPWAEIARHLAGLGGCAAIVIGVWGLAGWAVAAIVAGVPFAGFYLYGEARSATSGGRPE